MVYISLRLVNANSKIKVLTSWFWSIIGGRLGVSFSNSHICEGVSLETEVPPQVDSGVCVLNCNFLFLLPILLKCFPLYWLYQWKLDTTPFLAFHLFYKSSFGGGSNKNFGFRWFPIYLFCDLICCVFSSVVLISPFDISVSFVGFHHLLFILVSLVIFWHHTIVVICEDDWYVKCHNRCWWIIKSSRRRVGYLLYLHIIICFCQNLFAADFIL